MYMEKIKLQKELSNENAWLNGLYIYEALCVSLYNNFGRKETQQPANYPEQPYNLYSKPKSKEEIEREKRLKIEEQIRERNAKIKEMLNKSR